MTLSKKYSTSIIASIIVAVLVIGISFQGSTAETLEFDPTKAAINDLEIEATFNFVGFGDLGLKTFSVYQQTSGFKRGDPVAFRLVGLAGIDKIGLYQLADKSAQQRFGSQIDPINQFGVTVAIVQNEQVLHEFKYNECRVEDYNVATLFDADETFSGKTQFAIVDVFDFECKGYEPNTPLFEKIKQKVLELDTTSTMDLVPGVTWKEHNSFQKGFSP